MRIDGEKPLSLLSPTTSHATANDRSGEVCNSSRVPAVQAYGVSRLRGYWSAERLEPATCIQRLKRPQTWRRCRPPYPRSRLVISATSPSSEHPSYHRRAGGRSGYQQCGYDGVVTRVGHDSAQREPSLWTTRSKGLIVAHDALLVE
ncbi:unnamed protein product, partial [Ectocarpus sp. 8 AP-2014]